MAHGKLHDLGSEGMAVEAMPAPPTEKSKYYPTLYLDTEQLPGLDDYDVGDDVMLVLHARVKRKNESDGPEGKRCSVDLELRKGTCEAM